jgi:hypothetical protein
MKTGAMLRAFSETTISWEQKKIILTQPQAQRIDF